MLTNVTYKVEALSQDIGKLFNSYFDNYLDDYYKVYIKPISNDLTQFQVYIYFDHQRHYYDFVRCNLLLEKQNDATTHLTLSFFHGDAYNDYWRAAILIGILVSLFSTLSWVNLLNISLEWLFLIVPIIFLFSFLFMRFYSMRSVKPQKRRIITAIEYQLKKNFQYQRLERTDT